MWLVWALVPAVHAATCDGNTYNEDVAETVRAAEQQFTAMEIDAFYGAVNTAEDALLCLGEPISAVEAASYHRLLALDAYVAQDEQRTVDAFRSSAVIHPTYTLSEEIAPIGNPLRDLYEEARAKGMGKFEELAANEPGALFIDGSRTTSRPLERPSIVQLVNDDGSVRQTAYLQPADALPYWVKRPTAAVAVVTEPVDEKPERGGKGPRIPMLAGAGAAALGAGALYLVAGGLHADYVDPANPDVASRAELDALKRRTNTMAYASMGAGAVAVGLGVGAVLVVDF